MWIRFLELMWILLVSKYLHIWAFMSNLKSIAMPPILMWLTSRNLIHSIWYHKYGRLAPSSRVSIEYSFHSFALLLSVTDEERTFLFFVQSWTVGASTWFHYFPLHIVQCPLNRINHWNRMRKACSSCVSLLQRKNAVPKIHCYPFNFVGRTKIMRLCAFDEV